MPTQPSGQVGSRAGETLTGPPRPRQRGGLRTRVLDDETVVLDRQSARIHQLNRTAAVIWARCDGQHTVTQVARALAEAFDVDQARAEADVAVTLGELKALGLLEPPAAGR